MPGKFVTRREFLRLSALSGGAMVLAACGATRTEEAPPASTIGPRTSTSEDATAGGEEVLVSDVLDYALTSDEWEGPFGFVTFRLHQALHQGEPVYFIRTDTSDPTFAEENGLVFVPLLNAGRQAAASLYVFDDSRPPVMDTAPSEENYTSLFQIKNVTVNDSEATLNTAEAVEQAAVDGKVTIGEEVVFVNYPVVKWPGGELPVDTEKKTYLGTGPLLAPIDTEAMTVTFKLHQCFPGARYIVTDTSAAPMAPMMNIAASPPTQQLVDTGATDEIWVFANGIPGSGVMGFQPAIFDNEPGQPAWSPFWNHFTLKWVDESQARVLRSSAEVRAALEAGEVEQFNGTPDSHPNGFVVNCPVPVLAANTFEG